MRIRTFNAGWWFWVLLTLIVMTGVTVYGRRLDLSDRQKLVLNLSILELIIMRIYKIFILRNRPGNSYFNNLPCYLCNQSTLLCIAAAATGNNSLMCYCIVVGTTGSLLAYLIPDAFNKDQPFFSMQALGFYGYHGLLIITCLSFALLALYHPDLMDAFWNMVILFVCACIAHIFNFVLRKTGLEPTSNYVYTYDHEDTPVFKPLYRLFPVKLFYMVPILPFTGLLSLIVILIMKAFG